VEQYIIGILTALGLQLLKHWSHWNSVKQVAKAIVEDNSNPITDPAQAIRQALIDRLLQQNQKRIDQMAQDLSRMQDQAKTDEAAAIERGKANADGMQINIIPPDGTEEFKPAFPPKDDGTPK
jgi:gamma-glutamyl phosphate reductase